MTIKKEAERLWAAQKYEVMAKGYRLYSEVRDQFREAKEEEDYAAIIHHLEKLEKTPFSKKGLMNTAEHVWGYFKKEAKTEEKDHFFYLLYQCRELSEELSLQEPEAAELLHYITGTLLVSYPNTYLKQSTLLKNRDIPQDGDE